MQRLETVPGVGPITALTWALEMGDISRFGSIRQAISYCGLCGDEKKSAEQVMRTPLSKQRNKHTQSVLVEAAKLTPRYDPDLALVYENEKEEGERESSNSRGSTQNGCMSDGRGSRTTGFCTCGRSQRGGGLKSRNEEKITIQDHKSAGCQVLQLTE